jgi:hypothetical protein
MEDLCTLYDNILLNSSPNEKKFRTKLVDKIKTHVLCSTTFVRKVCRCALSWKKSVQPDTPQMAIGRMHVACWIPKARYTFRMFNIYCFPTATIVTRTRLSVTFVCALPVLVKVKLLRKIIHVVMKREMYDTNREFRDLCR